MAPLPDDDANPLWEYFANHSAGPGIWKWKHYFEIYHRHLCCFVGTPVSLVEIGIFSGGSLSMWRTYFGSGCHVHGVDIEEDCRAYGADNVSIHIGDQEDRAFWCDFRLRVPHVDVLIDDGGHTSEQQRITLEEMLPHLSSGGVYICEDVHGIDNRFAEFAAGLAMQLNYHRHVPDTVQRSEMIELQRDIYSVHFYPFMVVIEKRKFPLAELSGPRHGSEWRPPEWTERRFTSDGR